MTPKDIRNMVAMVRAIRAGKWTDELPAWVKRTSGEAQVRNLQEIAANGTDALRAVQTAEAFILLAHTSRYPFNETQFLKDCGFIG